LYQIVYASKASKFSFEEINNILTDSYVNNKNRGIKGVLLYAQGFFVQCIIGNKVDIQQTFERIKKDKRHEDIVVIVSGEVEELLFDDWTMSYVNEDAYRTLVEPIVKNEIFNPYFLEPKVALEVLKQVSLHL